VVWFLAYYFWFVCYMSLICGFHEPCRKHLLITMNIVKCQQLISLALVKVVGCLNAVHLGVPMGDGHLRKSSDAILLGNLCNTCHRLIQSTVSFSSRTSDSKQQHQKAQKNPCTPYLIENFVGFSIIIKSKTTFVMSSR
jgi:hypothetical protein